MWVSCRPCSTGSEFMPTGNLWQGTQTNLRWCASTPGLTTACLLSIMTAHNYPIPTHSNTWAWCHAQSLAATNRMTEQLNWLTVESFFMSCSISWMASLIDNLFLLDLIVLVINWQHVCRERTMAWARELVEALGTSDAKNSLLCWMVFPPWRPFLVRRRNHEVRCQ